LTSGKCKRIKCASKFAGEDVQARLAIANDPDADRLAAAEWHAGGEDSETGRWYTFTGNELGILLASWLWNKRYKVRQLELDGLSTLQADS
jgi:phosphomannomutase